MHADPPAQLSGAGAPGVVFAWLGPEGSTPPELPAFDAFVAPASHSFAFKGLWHCNWLQAFEVGIDPAHPSFLHRYLEDESSLKPPTAGSSVPPAPARWAASAGR